MTDHPSSEELRALYLGELEFPRSRDVAHHVIVEGCEHCAANLPTSLYLGLDFSSAALRMSSSETPRARSPFHVNANVIQRSDSSIVACAAVADGTKSTSSDNHARPPAAVSKVRNS